jgi:hypothetical protein
MKSRKNSEGMTATKRHYRGMFPENMVRTVKGLAGYPVSTETPAELLRHTSTTRSADQTANS